MLRIIPGQHLEMLVMQACFIISMHVRNHTLHAFGELCVQALRTLSFAGISENLKHFGSSNMKAFIVCKHFGNYEVQPVWELQFASILSPFYHVQHF